MVKHRWVILYLIVYIPWISYVIKERGLINEWVGCYKELPKYHKIQYLDGNYRVEIPLENLNKKGVIWNRIFSDSCQAKVYFFNQTN